MSSFTSAASAFATAHPAGPAFADAEHRAPHTKATVGLGLGLPTEVLHTSFAPSKSGLVGLGIYIPGFDLNGGVLVSPMTSDGPSSASSSSLPSSSSSPTKMLGTRLPRRRLPLVASPSFDEYAPMRTPSPSLMASPPAAPTVLFAFAVPNVPDLELIGVQGDGEGVEEHPFEMKEESEVLDSATILPSTESISSGLNLLSLSEEELLEHVAPGVIDDNDNEPVHPIGLGLPLAELDGPELVYTLREHGFLDNTHHDHNSSSSTTTTNSTSASSSNPQPTSSLDPHLASRYLAQGHMAHPKPSQAKWNVGFSLEDGSVADAAEASEAADPEKKRTPTLGFESTAFWERYLGVMYGEL